MAIPFSACIIVVAPSSAADVGLWRPDGGDPFAVDQHVGGDGPLGADDGAAGDQEATHGATKGP
jgi:hypothetical protein